MAGIPESEQSPNLGDLRNQRSQAVGYLALLTVFALAEGIDLFVGHHGIISDVVRNVLASMGDAPSESVQMGTAVLDAFAGTVLPFSTVAEAFTLTRLQQRISRLGRRGITPDTTIPSSTS